MGSVKCILLRAGLKDEFPRKPGGNPSVVSGGLLGQPQPAAKRPRQVACVAGCFTAHRLGLARPLRKRSPMSVRALPEGRADASVPARINHPLLHASPETPSVTESLTHRGDRDLNFKTHPNCGYGEKDQASRRFALAALMLKSEAAKRLKRWATPRTVLPQMVLRGARKERDVCVFPKSDRLLTVGDFLFLFRGLLREDANHISLSF